MCKFLMAHVEIHRDEATSFQHHILDEKIRVINTVHHGEKRFDVTLRIGPCKVSGLEGEKRTTDGQQQGPMLTT